MKNLQINKSLLNLTFCAVLILGSTFGVDAQKEVQNKLAKFLIVVETTDNDIRLTCREGCAWVELSFNSSINWNPQAVDQFGMTTLPRNQIKEDSLLSNFLFTIKRTKEGISFEGKEGTAWTKLSFGCPGGKCLQPIDQYGMTDPEKK